MDVQRMEGLGNLAEEIDAEGPPTAEQQQAQAVEAAGEENARQWGSVAFMVGHALAMVAPELRQVYTEEACLNWGRAMNPVAEKYGWNGPSALPELGLVIATAGLAMPSFFAVRARIEAVKEGEEKTGWLASLRDWWRSRRQAKPAGEGGADGG
jgi:hypothetical protein